MVLEGRAASHSRVLYFQRLVEKTHPTLEANLIKKLYDTYWEHFIKNMKIGPGVLETLKELKKRDIKISLSFRYDHSHSIEKNNKIKNK